MINLETLIPSTETTTVLPSDNLFKELGNNTYDTIDLLSELIDNSIAAKREDRKLSVKLIYIVDNENKPLEFQIIDDAKGIKKSDLGLCISPAAKQTVGKLNEHGLGMKQSIARMGDLKYLATKTIEDEKATLVKKFNFGNLETFQVDMNQDSGTIICVDNLNSIISTDYASMRYVRLYLGARYRRYLKSGDKKMNLTIEKKNFETTETIELYDICEVKPIYFHPNLHTNTPIFQNYEIKGSGWSAELTFGYSPKTKDDYQELGIEIPKNYHPYNVCLSKQGLDIISQDRVVLFSQISDKDFGSGFGLVPQRHNNFNFIRGEIVLKEGFKTAITKNSIISDENYQDCIKQVKRILSGVDRGPTKEPKDYLKSKVYTSDLPETLYRNRLAKWLKNNPLLQKEKVNEEFSIQGIEGFVDIVADDEAWELKTHPANALDVYQLFMYLDVGEFKKGYLVAKSFSPGAKHAADLIKTKHSKEIILSVLDKFPIMHQPDNEEREIFFGNSR